MYKAKYYTRPSEQPFEANVRLSGEKIIVEFYKNQVYTTESFDIAAIDRIDRLSGSCYIIAFKGQPIRSLELLSDELIIELRRSDKIENVKFKTQVHSPKKVVWFIALLATGIILLLVLLYAWGLPFIAEKVVRRIPVQYEKQLGEQLFKTNMAGQDIDTSLTRLSQTFFNSMEISSDTVVVTVVKNKEINAYAMPGGYIVVFDSIIKILNSPEEYAALLAHEYAHIKYRHSLRGIVRQVTGSALLGLITGDSDGAVAILAGQADKLKNLQYSRTLEQQADEAAIQMLHVSGIDPQGTISLFENMKSVVANNNQPGFEFLSTHPLFETREKYIREQLAKFKQKDYRKNNIKDVWKHIKHL